MKKLLVMPMSRSVLLLLLEIIGLMVVVMLRLIGLLLLLEMAHGYVQETPLLVRDVGTRTLVVVEPPQDDLFAC